MIFRIVGDAEPPPLTAYCMQLSAPENLLKLADGMTAGASSTVDNRATVMSLVIMAAAGLFVERLRWDEKKGMWNGSQRYLRDTNSDVITAEAIVWIHFLMGRLWKADQEKDHEMFERVGRFTVSIAARIALNLIKKETGFDFKARATESRKLYLEAIKDGNVSFEPFASVVLRSVGCQSLAEAQKTVGPLPPLEWSPLAVNVGLFFSTMPSAYYETFKNFLREWPERFPNDEDFDD